MKHTHIVLMALCSLLLGASAYADATAPILLAKCTPENLQTLKRIPTPTAKSKAMSVEQIFALTSYAHAFKAISESGELLNRESGEVVAPGLDSATNLAVTLGQKKAASKLLRITEELAPCAVEALRILKPMIQP